MKILVIGDANSIFVYEYVSEVLADSKYEVTLFNMTGKSKKIRDNYMKYYQTKGIHIINAGIKNTVIFHKTNVLISHLQYMLKLICCRKYDVVDVLFIMKEYFPLTYFMKKRAKLVLTVFGSDLLRASDLDLRIKEKLFKRANVITVETDYFLSEIERIYGTKYLEKVVKVGMGNKYIEKVDQVLSVCKKEDCKNKFKISQDKLVIFCGYSGSKEHKHIEILDYLETFETLGSSQLFIVFHCAYSLNEEYEAILQKRLDSSRFEGILLTDYLENEELLQLRMCADVMLNLQKTDALSSSMLESLAVGSIVVKGDWLVYPELEQANAFLMSISKLEDIGTCIDNIASNFEEYKKIAYKNKEIVYQKLSWNYKLATWKKVIDD